LKALILAGGFATRLRPLSCTRPKTLFPVLNKPLLEWIFERLAKTKVEEAILAVNSQTEFFIKKSKINTYGVKTVYSRDPPGKPLGTGGPVKRAEKLLGGEPFLVLNGDIFSEINYKEVIKMHMEKSDAVATIALCEVEDPTRFGVADLKEGNRIRTFIEKPSREETPTNLVNAGVYVLSPEIFNYIPKGRKVSLEREVFTKLVREGKLYGYRFNGLWMDIGKPEDYLKLHEILLNRLSEKGEYDAEWNIKIMKPTALDEGVFIGEKSIIGPYTVLGSNVVIGRNVKIKNSVVLSGTTILDSASIEDSVIGENVKIGKNVKIRKHCIIGDYVEIKDGVTLGGNVRVCPAKEIVEDVLEPKIII